MRKGFFILIIFLLLIGCKKETIKKDCVITYVQGDVKISVKDSSTKNAEVGDFLMEEDSIITDKDSIAELKIGDNVFVKINPFSIVKISVLLKNNETENSRLNISKGEIFTKCNKLNPGSSFEVQTKSITVGVRGTEFGVSNQNDKSSLIVIQGNVAVRKNVDIKKLNELENIDSSLANHIKENLLKEESISEGDKIEVDDNKIKESEDKINEKIDVIVEKKKNNENYEEAKREIIENVTKIKETKKEKLKEIEFNNIKNNLKFHSEETKDEKDKITIKINFNTDANTAILVSYNDLYYGKFYQNMEIKIDKNEKVKLKFASNDYEVEELYIDGEKIDKKIEVYNIKLKREDKKKKLEEIKKDLNRETEEIKKEIKSNEKMKDKINEKVEEKIKESEKTVDELDKELENKDKSLLDDLEDMEKDVKKK